MDKNIINAVLLLLFVVVTEVLGSNGVFCEDGEGCVYVTAEGPAVNETTAGLISCSTQPKLNPLINGYV